MKTDFKTCCYFLALSALVSFSACHSRATSGNTADTPHHGFDPNEVRTTPPAERPVIKTDLPDNQAAYIKGNNELFMYAVELSQMAQAISTNAAVKTNAQNTIGADMAAMASISSVAIKHSLLLPSFLNPDHQKTLNTLKKAKGAAFDQKYNDIIAESNAKLISNCKAAAATLSADDAKVFSEQVLPKAQQGLPAAK